MIKNKEVIQAINDLRLLERAMNKDSYMPIGKYKVLDWIVTLRKIRKLLGLVI